MKVENHLKKQFRQCYGMGTHSCQWNELLCFIDSTADRTSEVNYNVYMTAHMFR